MEEVMSDDEHCDSVERVADELQAASPSASNPVYGAPRLVCSIRLLGGAT
jgi:hypothetical protein